MRRTLRSPLPPRHGLDAVRLRTPDDGPWTLMRDHLVERLPRVEPERIDEMLADAEIAGVDGPLRPDSPFVPGTFVWLHRDLPDEVPVPFPIGIVHRDEHLLVVDKPHFLSTIPRGRHVVETAPVRLRRGLAPPDPPLILPRPVTSRIVKERGGILAQEVDGPPNAETLVELLEHRDGIGRYRLTPHSGRTHQLRLHMAGLDVPILGDRFYPELHDTALDDWTRPLQLCARTLAFTDPVTGEDRAFTSALALQAWDDHAGWVAGRPPKSVDGPAADR